MHSLPAPLLARLTEYNLLDLATQPVPRSRINIRYAILQVVANENGYILKPVNGLIKLEPLGTMPALRIVTRSDVAAQYGSGRR